MPPDATPASDAARRALRRRLAGLGLAFLALVLLAAAWSWSPLSEWLDVGRIVGGLQQLGRSFGPLAAVGGFALAAALAVPLVFLTLVTLVAFGPVQGTACVLAGALLGATASYALGAALGREAVLRLAGPRVNAVSRRLAQHGLIAVVAIRLVPVAPFAIVNMVCGASQIRLRHLLLGTVIGITPSIVAIVLFVDQIVAALRNPGPSTWAFLALTVALIAFGSWALRAWLRRRPR